jgi:RHH-type rel operon transcriptional repressor/antitoxin RelB
MEIIMNTTVTIRLGSDDKEIISRYARTKGRSVSDIVREAILNQIEDEYDLKLYRQAIEEYRKNPVSYSLDEIAKMLEIEV